MVGAHKGEVESVYLTKQHLMELVVMVQEERTEHVTQINVQSMDTGPIGLDGQDVLCPVRMELIHECELVYF